MWSLQLTFDVDPTEGLRLGRLEQGTGATGQEPILVVVGFQQLACLVSSEIF